MKIAAPIASGPIHAETHQSFLDPRKNPEHAGGRDPRGVGDGNRTAQGRRLGAGYWMRMTRVPTSPASPLWQGIGECRERFPERPPAGQCSSWLDGTYLKSHQDSHVVDQAIGVHAEGRRAALGTAYATADTLLGRSTKLAAKHGVPESMVLRKAHWSQITDPNPLQRANTEITVAPGAPPPSSTTPGSRAHSPHPPPTSTNEQSLTALRCRVVA